MKKERKDPLPKSIEILVVEDSITQAAQIRNLLESHNYKVTVAQNGKVALNRLLNHNPALVISDIMMPEMNGYELCEKIKSNRNTENIPVILLTILAEPEEILEGLSCGADSFISKPYNENYLLSHVERILSRESVVCNEKVPFSTQILFKGKKRFIQSEQQSVINLMLSIYEGAILQNEKLLQSQEELRLLNEKLEAIVEERTADLKDEIKLSNQIAGRLKESEERWRTLVLTIPDYIGLIDCEGKFLFLNHYANGFSEKDTIGRNHLDFIPEEWKVFYRQKFEECISTKKNQEFEYSAYGDQKEIRTYETCLVPLIHQDKVLNVMAIARDITERKLAEEQTRFQAHIIDNSPVIAAYHDKDLNMVWANRAYQKATGLSLEEIKGKKCYEVWNLSKSCKGCPVIAAMETGENAEYELTPHNQEHWPETQGYWLSKAAPVRDNQGAIIGALEFTIDITERKHSEEALQESEGKFKAIFQNSNDAIMLLDKKGFFDCNPQTLKVFNIKTKEEFVKLRPDELSPPFQPDGRNSFEVAQEEISIAYREGYNHFEWVHRRSDGEDFYAEVLLSVFDLRGERVLQATVRDITERYIAKEVIKKERRLLRTLIDNLPDQIYVKDSDCRKIIANKADVGNIGFMEEAEVVGKTDIELFPGQTGERGYDDDKKVINSGKAILDREEDFIDKNGIRRWLLTSKIPLYDKNRKITGLVGIGHDITQRKRANEELIKAKEKAEESDRLKTAFLHNISHEIRTPMNAIVGFSALLGEPGIDKKSQDEYIKNITHSSDHLLSLISDILEISNIEANIIKVTKQEVGLNSICNTLYDQFLLKAQEKRLILNLKTGLPDEDSFVYTDPTKITQIISNLLANAIKFTSEGEVVFGYTVKDKMIGVFVSDTGIGIPEEYHERIFDRFYQVQHSFSRLYEGQGLGLAVSKSYVEMLGGEIRVSSVPGQGSTFSFTIPYDKPVKAIEQKEVVKEPHFTFTRPMKILVAEDVDSNFQLIHYFLSGINAHVIRASNGKDAVDIVRRENNFDLILMDIKMPEMDGYTATKLIRQFNRDIPIIAQTAYLDDKSRAIEAGCSGFITKPFDKKGFLEVLQEFN